MTNTTASAARIATARAIGAGIRKTDTTVAEIVADVPAGFDAAARGAVASFVSTWINGDADAPAQKIGPKGDQTTTDYGRGFDTLVRGVKRALADSPTKSERLSVNYTDADGKTHTVVVTRESDATLYANLVSLANADTAADSE